MEDTSSYKDCKYFCYGRYCKYFYEKNKKKYGWDDLTEYMCIKSSKDICWWHVRPCKVFKKKSLWDRIKEKFSKYKI